jgi:hypothetical protein
MVVLLAVAAFGCGRADPGISCDKAEAVLKAYNYDDIEFQAASNGWSGTAIPAGGGYRMSVAVDRDGVLQVSLCAGGGTWPSRTVNPPVDGRRSSVACPLPGAFPAEPNEAGEAQPDQPADTQFQHHATFKP